MGQIRKIDDVYYIEFFARGLMYSQLAGSDEQQAHKMLQEIEAKISKGEALTVVREIEVRVFFQQFLEYAKGEFSPKSLKRFALTCQHFSNFLLRVYPQVKKLSEVTPAVIEGYKAELVKDVKPKVVNLSIVLLREVLEYGIKIGFINDNPTLHIVLLMLPPRVIRGGRRLERAKDLFSQGVRLEKICKILQLKDVAQIMFWSNFIPLKREDVYN